MLFSYNYLSLYEIKLYRTTTEFPIAANYLKLFAEIFCMKMWLKAKNYGNTRILRDMIL